MLTKEKIVNELRSILLTTLYFFCWFGGIMIVKVLLLREYSIQFSGFTIVLIGALIMAKVVLILEYIPISFVKSKPAWVEIIIRTLLYLSGVFIVLVLEKSFEECHEYGGLYAAFKNLSNLANAYHIWVNTICAFGALLVFNIWSVIKLTFGKDIFWKLMTSRIKEFE